MSEHTPLPWATDNDDPVIIVNAEGSSLGEITSGDPYIGRHEELANAAFIVRAVNCHAELVAALKIETAALERAIRRGIDDPEIADDAVANHVRLAPMRALLAKASAS